jgi:VCBS repeat-containing protein
MALVVADRVLETTTTTGTGALALLGAVTGYRAFDDVCANNDTAYYVAWAVDANGNPSGDWEAGLGTFTDTDTLTRTTPAASSNAGAAVDFAAGTKHVMLSATAGYLAMVDLQRVRFFFTFTPEASEVLLLFVAEQAMVFADDFAGSRGNCGTNPTGSFAMDVQKNGVSVGTITISTGGAFTFATSGSSVSLAAGDVLKVVAPSSADATCANVAISLKGSL